MIRAIACTLVFALTALTSFPAISQDAESVKFFSVSEWQAKQSQQNPSAKFAVDIFKVFAVAFANMEKKYIKPVRFATPISAGLKGLSSIDESLSVKLTEDKIIIFKDEIPLRTIYFSYDDPAEKWAKNLSAVIMTIKEKSQKINQLSSEGLYKIIFDNMLTKFDEHSKYFPKAEAKERKALHHGSWEENGEITQINNTSFSFINDDIALITISSFDSNTRQIVENILHNLYKNTKGVIIDLSGSNGGILSQAADVADMFLDKQTLFKVNGRSPDSNKTYKASGNMLYRGPVAIIVNRDTKSSSEAFTIAMQSNKRALVIGERSFGKGVSQTPILLPNGGEIMLSWAYIYDKDDKSLNNSGISPDIAITAPNTKSLHQKALKQAAKWFDEP